MPLLTPTIERELYAETDVRFWAQTGYRPGQKLDPKDPFDQSMMAVWQAIYRVVKAEWQSGKLVLTKDHPAVQQAIATAAQHTAIAVAHTHEAAGAAMPEVKAQHAAAAQAAQAQAAAVSKAAGAAQPPSVAPALVAQAVQKIADVAAALPSVAPEMAVTAMAAAHAPEVAQAAQDHGTPAPEKKSTGKTLAVIGGCFAAIALAGYLNTRDDASQGRYRR